MKRIWVGNTSSTVYVNILKGNSRLCQVIAVISGPRTIICKAFRTETLAVTTLGSIICSEGATDHASSLYLPTFLPSGKKPLKFFIRE